MRSILRSHGSLTAKIFVVSLGFLLLAVTINSGATEQTWTGVIGDSHCGAAKHPTEYRGRKITERECILGTEDGEVRGCIRGGGEFILVSGGKVYKIRNQDFAGLRVHAADNVRLTCELAGDTITVKSITKLSGK